MQNIVFFKYNVTKLRKHPKDFFVNDDDFVTIKGINFTDLCLLYFINNGLFQVIFSSFWEKHYQEMRRQKS